MGNTMIEKLKADQPILGLCNMYPASGIIECMSKGWDFVWIDGQHGQHTLISTLHAVQTCTSMGLETLIRVPGHEAGILGPFADLKPSALMIPMVNTPEEARAIVRAACFPPLGERSYGGRRVIDIDGRDYFQDPQMLVVAQIETMEACDNVEAIAAVEGIDVVFFGPDDMKIRMGVPVNTPINEDDRLRDAMAHVAKAARGAGKFASIPAATSAALRMALELGYRMFIGGGDVGFLRVKATEALHELRSVLGAATSSPDDSRGQGAYGG